MHREAEAEAETEIGIDWEACAQSLVELRALGVERMSPKMYSPFADAGSVRRPPKYISSGVCPSKAAWDITPLC